MDALRSAAATLRDFVTMSVPVLVGFVPPNSGAAVYWQWAADHQPLYWAGLVTGLALGLWVLFVWRRVAWSLLTFNVRSDEPAALLLALFVLTPLAFAATRFTIGIPAPGDPRFVTPMYCAAPLFVVALTRLRFPAFASPAFAWSAVGNAAKALVPTATKRLPTFGGRSPVGARFIAPASPATAPRQPFAAPALAGLLAFALLVGTNLASSFAMVPAGHEHPRDAQMRQVIAFLHARGLDRVWAGYWDAYRLDFLAYESIIAAPADYRDAPFNRYPRYVELVKAAPAPAWLEPANSHWDDLFAGTLAREGITYRREVVGGFAVYYDLSRPVLP